MSADGEIELQLRLDANGRTACDPSKPQSAPSAAHAGPDKSSDDATRSKDNGGDRCTMDYSSRAVLTELAEDFDAAGGSSNVSKEKKDLMDDLLYDCEVADCGLLPRTFWMPSANAEPRCRLEEMALEVFRHHVPKSLPYDPATSGAEWWVQIRPSPPLTGRYSMLAEDDNDDEGDMARAGISFHWDKDEELRLMMGGSMYVHPHISTVTYLTSIGAPTMVLNYRINNLSGEYIEPAAEGEEVKAYVSWPKRGKHLSFDGRYLHAAPSDLMKEGEFKRQCQFEKGRGDQNSGTPNATKAFQRRHRRVTFLVNVWLNYKPFNVNLFPETMIDKLSAADGSQKSQILFDARVSGAKRCCNERKINVAGSCASLQSCRRDQRPDLSSDTQEFSWPMGGCESKEFMRVVMPLETVRKEMKEGGNIRIGWKQGGNCGVLLTRPENPDGTEQECRAGQGAKQEAEVKQPADGVQDRCHSPRTDKRQKTSCS